MPLPAIGRGRQSGPAYRPEQASQQGITGQSRGRQMQISVGVRPQALSIATLPNAPAVNAAASDRVLVAAAAATVATPAFAAPSANTARPVNRCQQPRLGLEVELHGVRLMAQPNNKTQLATSSTQELGIPLLQLVVDGAHRDKQCIELVTAPLPASEQAQGGSARQARALLQQKLHDAVNGTLPGHVGHSTLKFGDILRHYNEALPAGLGHYRLEVAGGRDGLLLGPPPANDRRRNDYQQTNLMLEYRQLACNTDGFAQVFFNAREPAGLRQQQRFLRCQQQANQLAIQLARVAKTDSSVDTGNLRALFCQALYQDSILNELGDKSEFYKDKFPLFIKATLHDVLFSVLDEAEVATLQAWVARPSFRQWLEDALIKTFRDSNSLSQPRLSSLTVFDKTLLAFRAGCERQALVWKDIERDKDGCLALASLSAVDRQGRQKVFLADANAGPGPSLLHPYIDSRLAPCDCDGKRYIVAEARRADAPVNNKAFDQVLASGVIAALQGNSAADRLQRQLAASFEPRLEQRLEGRMLARRPQLEKLSGLCELAGPQPAAAVGALLQRDDSGKTFGSRLGRALEDKVGELFADPYAESRINALYNHLLQALTVAGYGADIAPLLASPHQGLAERLRHLKLLPQDDAYCKAVCKAAREGEASEAVGAFIALLGELKRQGQAEATVWAVQALQQALEQGRKGGLKQCQAQLQSMAQQDLLTIQQSAGLTADLPVTAAPELIQMKQEAERVGEQIASHYRQVEASKLQESDRQQVAWKRDEPARQARTQLESQIRTEAEAVRARAHVDAEARQMQAISAQMAAANQAIDQQRTARLAAYASQEAFMANIAASARPGPSATPCLLMDLVKMSSPARSAVPSTETHAAPVSASVNSADSRRCSISELETRLLLLKLPELPSSAENVSVSDLEARLALLRVPEPPVTAPSREAPQALRTAVALDAQGQARYLSG